MSVGRYGCLSPFAVDGHGLPVPPGGNITPDLYHILSFLLSALGPIQVLN